jgi:hypothetical protein
MQADTNTRMFREGVTVLHRGMPGNYARRELGGSLPVTKAITVELVVIGSAIPLGRKNSKRRITKLVNYNLWRQRVL